MKMGVNSANNQYFGQRIIFLIICNLTQALMNKLIDKTLRWKKGSGALPRLMLEVFFLFLAPVEGGGSNLQGPIIISFLTLRDKNNIYLT